MDTPNIPVAAAGSKTVKIILIVVALAVIAALAWWFVFRKAPAPEVAVPGTANQPMEDLGSALYNSASNPVSGKLPDTVAPVPNPVGGLYKNPF